MNNSDLNKAAQYFESVFTVSHEGIIFVDHEGTILRINPALTEILGYEEHELQGKPFYTLAYKDQKTIDLMSKNSLHRFYSTKEASMELILLDKKGCNVPVRLRSVLIRNNYDQVTGAIGAALLAKEDTSNGQSRFKGFREVIDEKYDLGTFTCNRCDNNCAISRLKLNGESPAFYGSRCDYYDSKVTR